jgi:hypothetical protein
MQRENHIIVTPPSTNPQPAEVFEPYRGGLVAEPKHWKAFAWRTGGGPSAGWCCVGTSDSRAVAEQYALVRGLYGIVLERGAPEPVEPPEGLAMKPPTSWRRHTA